MLRELRIENLAVIERASPQFEAGFNAITGETGAGKSVLLSALSLALGTRADSDLVRAGSQRARAAAIFTDVDQASLAIAERLGVAPDQVLVLARELGPGGRGSAHVNGGVAPVSSLREIGDRLLELHGQGSSSRWLKESDQRLGLDGFGGPELIGARSRVDALWERWRAAKEGLSGARARTDVEREQLARAEQDLAELRPARLRLGEEEELRQELGRLLHLARLRESAARLARASGGGPSSEDGASQVLAEALREVRGARALDPELETMAGQVEGVLTTLSELELQLGSYLARLPDDSRRQGEVEERLDLLQRLARRHGGSVEAAVARLQEAERELAGQGGGQDLHQLEAQARLLEGELGQACCRLSELRSAAAQRLEAAVTEDLHSMLMPDSRFLVRLWRSEQPEGVPAPDGGRFEASAEGWDRVSFELAANPGDSPRPLGEVASGGELARVALSLLAQLSHESGVGTVVFDEIDQGLAGEAANRVGELLRKVSRRRQVICVTHLAPIAARADHHLQVSKRDHQGRAVSEVRVVSGDARVAELARLLAGEATPEAARTHATQLLLAVGSR